MQFRLNIDRNCQEEEITATVRERTPLVSEIERLVLAEGIKDQVPGYTDEGIVMIGLDSVDCFTVEDEKTYAVCSDRKRYSLKVKLYELEAGLPGNFERISRSAIGNWKKIVKFKVHLSGAVDAVFRSGYAECVSRRCFAEIKRRHNL